MAEAGRNKVLKTLVIKEGKVVEERVIKADASVTVGSDAKNTFVLPDDNLPSQAFILFEATESGYRLNFSQKMKGKVAVGGKKFTLRKLRKDSAARRTGDMWSVPLGEDDKGSVEIGDGAVWFKFEAPPAPPPTTQAVRSLDQIDFRPRLFQDDDPLFMGFVAVWSAAGALLLLAVWNLEPPEFQLEELPDRFTKMVIEEPAVEPEEVEDPIDDLEGESASQKKEEKAEKAEPQTKEEKAVRQEEVKKEVLASSQLLINLIGTTGENSQGVVENMWGDGDDGLGDIDGALSEVSGATTEGGPQLRTGQGVDGEAAGIGDLGGVEGGTASVGGGPKVEAKPQVNMGQGSMDDDIGNSGSAKSVVKRNFGQLRYCYERLLRTEQSLEGRVEIGWSVYGGSVEGVYVVSNSTGSSALADCIVKKIERWTFPDDIEGDMSWPFVFRTQE